MATRGMWERYKNLCSYFTINILFFHRQKKVWEQEISFIIFWLKTRLFEPTTILEACHK